MEEELRANSSPDESGFYKGLAQAPLHFNNMVAELIDNAISAKDKDFNVYIDISSEEKGGDNYIVRIWDDVPGISLTKLKNEVFKTGCPPSTGSDLNEHGYGLKNVLSKAQELTKADWTFQTRDRDAIQNNVFYECRRPLSFSQQIFKRDGKEWQPFGPQSTGTIVTLHLPLTYLQTVAVAPGRRGSLPANISTIMDYLREHLGVYYRGFLEKGIKADGKIFTSIEMISPDPVSHILPDYESKNSIGPISINYKGRKINVEGEIGLIMKESAETKKRKFYYKHAPDSQGVDFRIGRRVVATRLISEIWDRERHPSLNGIAGEIRFPEHEDAKPPTLNNKTSLNFDSEIWSSVIQAVNQDIPPDKLPHGGGKSEGDLREELYTHIKGLAKLTHEVQQDYDCGNGVYVDVYWNQAPTKDIDIYEVKKGKAKALDVYQLVMYWDSLVAIGIQPSHGHLVSDGKTSGVDSFLKLMLSRKDTKNTKYNLVQENWSVHGIKTD
ncbi:MAG: ATP-binding protein [candidate division Zixibacteria bacterium]|nr:ATP-binding protein [candidate division Zixibacteria bacterium]